MAQPFRSSLDVPVAGGTLHVGVAGPAPGTDGVPIVLAVHGITGSHRSWAPVARHLGDAVTVLAPDLRGRGESAEVGGPYGMASHVEDLLAVLDHTGCGRAELGPQGLVVQDLEEALAHGGPPLGASAGPKLPGPQGFISDGSTGDLRVF